MEIPSVRWLSELGMEDPAFIHECQMDSFDGFSTQQIAATLGQDFQHSFSSESFSSYPTFKTRSNTATPTTAFSGSSMDASHTGVERPAKQIKTNSWNSCTTENISSTPEASSSPNILSFGNPNLPINQAQQLYGNLMGNMDEAVSSANMIFPSYVTQNYVFKPGHGTKRMNSATTKPPSHTQDHIIAERKRREKLSQRFIALSAIVPGLKKMDKASVLGDAIKYLKQLQERVKILEEQTVKKRVESVVLVKRSQISADDDNSSSDENNLGGGRSDDEAALPEIEARVSDKDVLIRVHSEKQKGVVAKALAEIEKLHLTVVNSSVIPFGKSALNITIVAVMEPEFSMKVKDLVRHLNSAFRQFM
ncbi:PREDICTED: transcription factor bHLH18-like [Nelumbo nucifera]|uniref:Transcription factor bHLH18-like n=2 Tax=Nelumbo nucifera TaxID=4432 RepID=A0A1U8Q8A6_NELNU|nr:PREDICTED: transcription factor bHLH18-like [Nelumbo nucifera]XP_019055013.1 PREDICTED: transcription factor bHLH18-like [Nelumbo nucifera]DAD40350.1 TPA_asm: hypothetical protein HUJ06_014673 [Nelumbo nucifera]